MNDLGFFWPWALVLIPLLLIIFWFYRRVRQGKAKAHVVYADTSLLAQAAQKSRPWRHLPAVFYVAALAVALMAMARPTAKILVPDTLSGIMLSMETSNSMRSWDIEPTRLEASKIAAKSLVDTIPKDIKVGLTTFSGYGTVNVPLTTDRKRLFEGIDNLNIGGSYAFSDGLLASLEALPQQDSDLEAKIPGAIVLFSHGHDNSGRDTLAIADEAAERGIKIHTIGVGTHGNNFSEDVLKTIADRTEGEYYPIFSAEDLTNAHKDLAKLIRLRPKTDEVTAIPALAAALLLGFSLLLAQFRRRIV